MGSRRRIGGLAAALALAVLIVVPPVAWTLTSAILAKGTLTEEANVNNDRIRFRTKGPTDVHTQTATFAPGDVVNWHHHPGFALITVNSGTLTFYDAQCRAHTVGEGRSFVETGGPAKTVNEGDRDAVIHVTYVVPEGSRRTEGADAPPCDPD